jgi:hypothetical protein
LSVLNSILSLGHKGPPKVLGVCLKTFCVGHALALHRLESPVIFGGSITLPDLIEAVAICAEDPSQAERMITSRFRWLLFKLWSFRLRRMNLLVEKLKFEKWISSQSNAPEIIHDGAKKSKKLSMPWPERILISLMDLGFREETALRMAVIDAERLVLAHAEMHGQVELWSEEQEALWEYAQSSN